MTALVRSNFDYSANRDLPEVSIRIALLMERLQGIANVAESRILEVGLGAGDVTLELSRRFGSVTCMDIDELIIDAVKGRLQEEDLAVQRFVISKIEKAEFPAASFDHIVLFNILEHLEDPPAGLRRIRPWLSPGGTVHVTVNLANSLHRWLGVAMGMIEDPEQLGESDRRLGHYWIYTQRLLREHVAAADLNVSYEKPFYVKPLPTSMLTGVPREVHAGLNKLAERFPQFAAYVYLEATT